MSSLSTFAAHVMNVIGCVLLADLLSGCFHWLDDAYGREQWPITGWLVTRPNILHHNNPRHFTRHTWLQSSWLLIAIVFFGVAAVWFAGYLDWRAWLVAAIGINVNQIHKWAHRSAAENGRLISFLHRAGIIQSPLHHAQHHRYGNDTHYCVVTSFLNPILDRARVWQGMEWVIYQATGVKRRSDRSRSTESHHCRRDISICYLCRRSAVAAPGIAMPSAPDPHEHPECKPL